MAAKQNKQERDDGIIAIVAALIVLFSAMWNPMTSVVVAIAAMIGFSIWKFIKSGRA